MSKTLRVAFLCAILLSLGALNFPYRDVERAKATIQLTTSLTDIQIKEERAWVGCGIGDTYKTKFSAIDERGQPVNGIVCRDIFKGATIRYQ